MKKNNTLPLTHSLFALLFLAVLILAVIVFVYASLAENGAKTKTETIQASFLAGAGWLAVVGQEEMSSEPRPVSSWKNKQRVFTTLLVSSTWTTLLLSVLCG